MRKKQSLNPASTIMSKKTTSHGYGIMKLRNRAELIKYDTLCAITTKNTSLEWIVYIYPKESSMPALLFIRPRPACAPGWSCDRGNRIKNGQLFLHI